MSDDLTAVMDAVVEEPTMEVLDELRVADRCDYRACGAQAFVITVHDKCTLYWCSHHYAALEDAIVTSGGRILQDARERINATASTSRY